MKYYTSATEFNCGIDLHAQQMYVCVMDKQGKKLVHTNIKDNDFQYFLKLVQPYQHSLTVCCECMFGWYWLADACQQAGLTFVLAHALYVKAIHGGKNKNDRVDSEKLTHLLRSNLIPPAYVYPADKRPLRALLRQRIFYVWRRSELPARIHSHQLAHNRLPARQTRRTRDPWEEQLLAAEDNPLRQIALKNDLAMIRHFDQQIFALEEELQRQTKQVAGREYTLLQSVPGIGENLGLTILYEIGDIARFPTVKDFLSYCRLVKGTVASAAENLHRLTGSEQTATPLSVTEHNPWRLERRRSALGTSGIRRLDWVLRPGACGPLTALALWSTHALDLQKKGTRETGLAEGPPVSFVRKRSGRAGELRWHANHWPPT